MNHDDLARENESLRERISALSAASLRVGASLDLETVLQRGRRERPRAHRRALRRHRHHRRGGPAPRTSSPPASPTRSTGACRSGPTGRGCSSISATFRDRSGWPRPPSCARARLLLGPAAVGNLPGHPDAPPGRACRQLLSRRQGGRAGVHRRGRGGPGAVRRAGGGGDRQRAHLPGRAAGAGRPRGAGRDLAGRRRGVRCPDRRPGVAQPRGDADRGEPAHAGPQRRGSAPGDHLPARRRARDRARPVPARRAS